MSDSSKKSSQNQGEGDRKSAARYNKEQQEFIKSERGRKKIEQADEIQDSKELRQAEKEGKSRAKEKDPAVKRDYKKES